MKWTKKQLEDFPVLYKDFMGRFMALLTAKKTPFHGDSIDHVQFMDDGIHFRTEEKQYEEESEYYNYIISFDSLLNMTPEELFADIKVKKEAEIVKLKEAEEKHKAEEKIKFAKRKEEQDLRDYRRLKKKYAKKKS